MIYELHKTTEDTKETICTITDILKALGEVTIDNYIGKHRIDITIRNYDSITQ